MMHAALRHPYKRKRVQFSVDPVALLLEERVTLLPEDEQEDDISAVEDSDAKSQTFSYEVTPPFH